MVESYPTTWQNFLGLRAAREAFWANLPRAEYDAHPSRRHRKIYHDASAGIFYLVDRIDNTDGLPDIKFAEQRLTRFSTEMQCYSDSAVLGYHVAMVYAGVPFADLNAGPVRFNAVIATAEIKGPSIATLQTSDDPRAAAIVQEALVQSVVYGITLADRDRGNVANILLADGDLDNPILYHIDFEEAGKATLEKLFAQLEANYGPLLQTLD